MVIQGRSLQSVPWGTWHWGQGTSGLISSALKYLRKCACFTFFICTKMGKERQTTQHRILQVMIFQIPDIQMPQDKASSIIQKHSCQMAGEKMKNDTLQRPPASGTVCFPLWTSHLIFLGLSFLICKQGTIILHKITGRKSLIKMI